MAAQVEVQTGEVGRTVAGGRLHLSPLTDSNNKSLMEIPPINQSHIITPEPNKPVPGPKPRLTPKPFVVDKNPTIKPILAPKPQTKPQLESTRLVGYKPDLSSSPKPQQPIAAGKPRPVSTNTTRAAPTTFKTSNKLKTGQTTRLAAQPFKPAPPLDPADLNKPTPPVSVERNKTGPKSLAYSKSLKKPPVAEWPGTHKKEEDEDQITSSKPGTPITRAKSMGCLDQVWQEEEKEKAKTVAAVPLRPQPRTNRPRPVSAIFLDSPTKTERPVPAPRWSERRPLSADLTSKFESIGLSLHRKTPQANTKENTLEETAMIQTGEEEKTPKSIASQSHDGAARPNILDQSDKKTEEMRNVKDTDERKRGGSIKSRISLLLDSSLSPGAGATGQAPDLNTPVQVLHETEPQVGVKQLIRQLTEDAIPTQSPVMKPAVKPRPLPLDLTKRFSTERSPDLGSPSLNEATDNHEISKDPQQRTEESAVNPSDQWTFLDLTNSQEKLKQASAAEGPEVRQTLSIASKESGPTSDVQTVRASLFENVVERHSVLMVDEGKPVNKSNEFLSSPSFQRGSTEDEGILVTATYKEPVAPSSPLRVVHAFDTVQAVEENRAVSESIPLAHWEDRAMTLHSRRSEGSKVVPEVTGSAHGEPALAATSEQYPRYLRVGALHKWSTADFNQDVGIQKGMLRESQKEVALDKDKDKQKEAKQEEVAVAPTHLKRLHAEEQSKPKATYFALTAHIQEPLSPVDGGTTKGGITSPFDDFSVQSLLGSSQGKILPVRRKPSLDKAFGRTFHSQDQVEESVIRRHMSHKETTSVSHGQVIEETMGVEKIREAKMKELEREKQRQTHLEFARMKEREMQREFERQRQKAFESEEKQRALERQKQMELENQKLWEREREKLKDQERERQQQIEQEKLELERQKEIERVQKQERERQERQRQREEERQRELERERHLLEIQKEKQKIEELERIKEFERQELLEFQKQKQIEKERQQALELEKQRQRERMEREEAEKIKQMALEQEMLRLKEIDKERERQKEMEKERQRELERQRQKDLEKERQRQLDIERQELENQRLRQEELDKERLRKEELERIKEMERRQLLEFEKQKQKAEREENQRLRQQELDKERHRKEELERQALLELQKQKEKERQQALEFEKQRQREKMEREEAEKIKRMALEQEMLRLKELDKERERQKEMEKERQKELEWKKQRELERQRQQDLEKERQRQLDIERQELENQRLRQQELDKERLRKEELERIKEMERRQLLEFEKQKQKVEREAEWEKHKQMEKMEREEADKMRQIVKQQEAERQRLKEKQKKEEQERARLESSPLRPKVVDLDSVRNDQLSKATPQRSDPATRWKEPSPRAEESYKPTILDIDYFTSQTQLSPHKDLFSVSGIQSVDTGFGSRLQPTPDKDVSWKVPPQTPASFSSPVWASPQDPWELLSNEMSVDKPVAEPSKHANKISPEQLLHRQEQRLLAPQMHLSTMLNEPLLAPFNKTKPASPADGVSSSGSSEPIWFPREPQHRDSKVEVQSHRRSKGSQDLNRMRSRSVSRRSAPTSSSTEENLSRMRSRSAHREGERHSWVQQKQSVRDEEEAKESETPVRETDSQYGTWETGLRTDDSLTPATPSSETTLSPSPRKPSPPHTPGEHGLQFETDTLDSLLPSSSSENQTLSFPDAPTTLLDTSILRSRAQLGKKRAPRTRPSRAARLAEEEGGSTEDWLYRDSTGAKVESKDNDSDSEEQNKGADVSPAVSSQPQRVALFPGVDPSALKAQLKKRGDSDNQIDGLTPSPSQLPRTPKSPFLPRAARVLPTPGGKENGEEDSPQWLKELKSKKRLSQYENEH